MGNSRLLVLEVFTRQFATLVQSNIPVIVALGIIAEKIGDESIRGVLDQVKKDVEGGSDLAAALAKHPAWFSSLYTTLVRVGERHGSLAVIMTRLAAYQEAVSAFRARVLSGILVPSALAAAAGLAGLWLLRPTLGGVTACVIAVLLCALPVFVALALLPAARLLPGMRGILRKVDLARFARTMGTLQRSGVPIIDAVETVAPSALDPAFREALGRAVARLRGGEHSVALALQETGRYPEMVIQMVAAGEETGKLDDMFLRIADFYDAEAESAVEGVNKAAATALTFVVALAVALLVQGIVAVRIAGLAAK